MTPPVALNAMYVILGASGNTGSIIANSLAIEGQEGARHGDGSGDCSVLWAKGRKRSPPI